MVDQCCQNFKSSSIRSRHKHPTIHQHPLVLAAPCFCHDIDVAVGPIAEENANDSFHLPITKHSFDNNCDDVRVVKAIGKLESAVKKTKGNNNKKIAKRRFVARKSDMRKLVFDKLSKYPLANYNKIVSYYITLFITFWPASLKFKN